MLADGSTNQSRSHCTVSSTPVRPAVSATVNRRVIFFSAISFSSQVIFNIKFYVLSDQHYLYPRYRLFPKRRIRSCFILIAHFSYFLRVINSDNCFIKLNNVLSLYPLLNISRIRYADIVLYFFITI